MHIHKPTAQTQRCVLVTFACTLSYTLAREAACVRLNPAITQVVKICYHTQAATLNCI